MATLDDGYTEWFDMFGQKADVILLCGVALALIGTCAFMYEMYSLVGRYPDQPPAWATFENLIKHFPNSQKMTCLDFYLGSDLICLALLPELKSRSRAFLFFTGLTCICLIVVIGFGHVCPHVCRMIRKRPAANATEFRGDTIFLDFTVPMSEVCVKALAQISLFSVYVVGLYDALIRPTVDISLTYWAISIVAVQFYMFNADPQTSRSTYISSAHLIEEVFSRGREHTCFVRTGEAEWIRPPRPSMILRCILHFVVNGVGFVLIWLTVPLLVSYSESPLDYLMNLFAVTFLTQLDDATEAQTFQIRFQIGCDNVPCSIEERRPRKQMLSEHRRSATIPSIESGTAESELESLRHRLAVLEAKFGSS
ncbi:unnamed protein product [Prorocentrum cordatum]|uniref:Uncharacterized protein n=1 Tax=Prorocentrum cordatum TaxID=2364126 RepID=A0ABN9PGN6_9DINO|nr:unnamed protein product [Polarella glacialis]